MGGPLYGHGVPHRIGCQGVSLLAVVLLHVGTDLLAFSDGFREGSALVGSFLDNYFLYEVLIRDFD